MRRRLVLTIAGVATVAVVVFAVPLGVALQRRFHDEAVLRLQRDTVAATRAIDLSPGRADPVELPRSDDALAVYGRGGDRVAGRGPARAPALVRSVLRDGQPADEARTGLIVVAVPLLAGERVAGAVRAARSSAATTDDARRAWLEIAAFAAAVILTATLAALTLGRRLARPLERLAVAARRIGHGDFSVRAPRSDVVEVDDVAAALDSSAERLGELVARERAFSTDASHQLRTPLAALRLELEAMQLHDDHPPRLTTALAQVDRLQATIDTLLAVARDTPQDRATTDLGPLLDERQARWRGPLAAVGRPLRLQTPSRPLPVRASPQVIGEILDVLLDNARRHGRGEVRVTARPAAAYIAVEVGDEGPGFSVDVEEAFERRRGDGTGHGIGLALARSLAHAEGGRVDVPHPGPRPVVRLLLPAPAAEVTASEGS